MNLLLRIVATALAVWVAGWLVPGIRSAAPLPPATRRGRIVTLLLVSLVFGLVNSFVKPVVQVLSGCFILLTFGLFLLVINAAMLMLTS